MKPGIYDIEESAYHDDPCAVPSLSSSIAKILINATPLHAWTAHPKLNPNFVREDKEIFDLGTVAHALMLQGLEVAYILPIEFTDWKKNEAKALRDMARTNRKVPILAKNWSRVQAMVQSGKRQIAAHKEASDAFTNGKPEQTLVWEDDHGVMCRARLDWLHDSRKIIDDYKTTGMPVDPDRYGRMMDSNGWDIQSAFYRRGIRKLFNLDAQFRFIAQETSEPHALCVMGIGPDFQWSGDSKVQRAIDLWAQCLKSNKWPGWTDRIAYPVLPPWAESREENKQLQEVS